MSDSLDGFSRDQLVSSPPLFTEHRVVRFQEVDAAGIIFYARVYDYFHDAYVGWLAQHGVKLHELVAAPTWIAPVKRSGAEYLRPMRFGDEIAVSVVRARFDRGDLHVGFRIDNSSGAATAVGHNVHAVVDAKSFKRTDPPAAFRESIGKRGGF